MNRVIRGLFVGLVLGLVFASSALAAQPYVYNSAGLKSSGVVARGLIQLHGCLAFNNNAAIVYLQFFDSATVPADAVVPDMAPIALPAGVTTALDAGIGVQQTFSNGLAWAESSTAATKTLTATSDVFLTCLYN